ncbi:MAG: hypothetical protein IJN56_06045 [Clostridia bacterium]|nr:hypothetical protein [Clostridia bacterium]
MFVLALLFGVGQVLLTWQLVIATEKRFGKRIFLFSAIKFLLYGVGIGLLIFKHIWDFNAVMCGFVVGVPITAIGLFVYKTFFKK